MTRRRLALIFLPALILLLLVGSMAWLLRTEIGANWLWSRVTAAVPELSAARVRGDLRSGLDITGLVYAGAGTTVRLDQARVRFAFDLLPLAVTIESLEVGRLEVQPVARDGAAPRSNARAVLQAMALPLPIRIPKARIREFHILDVVGTPRLRWSGLTAQGRWDDTLDLRSFSAVAEDRLTLKGSARLELRAPFALAADLSAAWDPDVPAASAVPSEFTAHLSGNLETAALTAGAEPNAIRVTGELTNFLDALGWDLELHADRVPLRAGDAAPEMRNVRMASTGSLSDYRLILDGLLAIEGLEPAELTLTGSGDLGGIIVEQARLSNVSGDATATGTLAWSGGLRVDATAALERFDPSRWIGGWPAAHPLTGSIGFAWAGASLHLPSFRLAAAGTAFQLEGTAELNPAADKVTGQIRWSDFTWPPGSAQPAFGSPAGELTLGGRPDDWTANGNIRLSAPDLPEGSLELTAHGDTAALHLDIARGEVLGGQFSGELDYRWGSDPLWTARLEASSLRTAVLRPEYPGVLNATLALEGRIADGELDIAIESLDGTVRGRAVSASGRLVLASGVPRADDLVVKSGNSEITLDGNPRQADGIRFRARIESLGDLVDGATGRIETQGRLQLASAVPQMELRLEGENLAWRDWKADSIGIAPSGSPDGASSHRIAMTGARFADVPVDELVVNLEGDEPLQRIRAEAQLGDVRISALLEGAVADWAHPADQGWRGRVAQWRADHASYGFIELVEPAALRVSGRAAQLDLACLRGGEICIEAAWQAGANLDLAATLDGISLEMLRLLGVTNVALTQQLTGQAEWHRSPSGDASGMVRIAISAGELMFPDDALPGLSTSPGVFEFDVREGRLESGRFGLDIVGVGAIDADFGVPDLSRGSAATIDGRLRANFSDIGPLMALLPFPDRVAGRFDADFRIAGTASDPSLTGHMSLVRGQVEHFATGLVISDLQLAGAVYDNDVTELNGTFRAGTGVGRIRAMLDFANLLKPGIALELQGDDLALVDVPDVGLTVDPDLRLDWRDGVATIDGSVLVERARLSPRYLPTATATESADLVIVAGAPPEAEEARLSTSPLKLRGSVEVTLGKDISVELDRATAEFGGKVLFTWNDQLMPIGDGSLTVTGEIYAYGQLLKIAEGRIRFPRLPADNPQLNIKAEREIFGSRQIKRAGVHVTGTVKRPVLEPYTEPMTTQERALTMLITGNDFDYEQGVGAVEVGTYVAPRLFISYGIGLFENQNVISARYDLKRGFGIKATSGQRETGVDISYTIER